MTERAKQPKIKPRAEQLRALLLRPGQQLIGELPIDQRPITVCSATLTRHHFSVSHLVIPSEPFGLRVGPRSLTQPV